MTNDLRVSWWDRLLMGFAPDWGLRRVRARVSAQMMARHFEAAQGGRRTTNWNRSASDANVANTPALAVLRELSRDLRRNNGWVKRGVQAVVNNTVGWGILPKPSDRSRVRSTQALSIWNDWASSTACDYDGQLDFYGLQRLAMECIVESGEVLIVKQPAATKDGLSIPMRIQVLEPDYLDHTRNGVLGPGPNAGPIFNGVEFDRFGRRVAYWLFTAHPGGMRLMSTKFYSERIPADRVLHVYRVDRPGQIRGVPWMASAITRLKDFDDFEDAELMQQKIAACFGAFVTDPGDGVTGIAPPSPGQPTTDLNGDPIDAFEPGHIAYLPPGKQISFATPPPAQDSGFSVRQLRRFAASLGVPYEVVSNDYSQVNYSSARMARVELKANVHEWRWHMLIPGMCNAVWCWGMELTAALEGWPGIPRAEWAPPPMTILEPDKEATAYQKLVRIGAMSWPQMIRELGEDPATQLKEIAEYNALMDAAGIALDSDPRRMTASGGVQQVWSTGSIAAWPPPPAPTSLPVPAGAKPPGAANAAGGGASDPVEGDDPVEDEDAATGAGSIQ